MDVLNLVLVYTQLVIVQANIYSILGLKKTASYVEIKKAYHKLALRYHPDRNSENDTTEKFIEITTAYNSLVGHQAAFECFLKQCINKNNKEDGNSEDEEISEEVVDSIVDDIFENLMTESKGFNVYIDDVQHVRAEDLFNL